MVDFTDVEYWGEKGYKNSKNRNIEFGIDYYLQGIALNPNHFEINYNLGCLYNTLDKCKAAIHWFSKAHIITPSDPRPILGLSLIMLKTQNYNE